jgi:hypothetical protein
MGNNVYLKNRRPGVCLAKISKKYTAVGIRFVAAPPVVCKKDKKGIYLKSPP